MAIFSMTLTSFYEDYAIKMKSEAELINELTKAQLNSLKLQINPHFIFNSLNSVSALTALDPGRAKSMIILLADYIRFSLTAGKNDFVSLNDEIENVRKYIEIESIRFGSRINYNEFFEPFSSDFKVPPLIIQPLIENCIKHGVENTSETVNINFRIKNYSDMILISIENNYEDFTKMKKKDGVGLKNVKERLKLHYNNVNLVKISEYNNLFVVELTLPALQ
ncbi:MAG: histidine kinase [Ignavibacteriaceae bacterium]|nr:histidine kinase [Ignavibacteriaceae bacterium]